MVLIVVLLPQDITSDQLIKPIGASSLKAELVVSFDLIGLIWVIEHVYLSGRGLLDLIGPPPFEFVDRVHLVAVDYRGSISDQDLGGLGLQNRLEVRLLQEPSKSLYSEYFCDFWFLWYLLRD